MTDQNTTGQEPAQTPQVNTDELVKQASEQAAKIAAEQATAQVRQEMVERITGKSPVSEDAPLWRRRGQDKPDDWDEVDKNTTLKAERIANKIVDDRLKKDKEEQLAKEASLVKQKEEYQKQWAIAWNEQITNLEKEGEIEAVPDTIKDKIAKNIALTAEERANPALIKQWDLRKAAYAENPYNNIEAYYYKQKVKGRAARQAATDAPVFGAVHSNPVSSKKDSFSYEEIAAARQKKSVNSLLE